MAKQEKVGLSVAIHQQSLCVLLHSPLVANLGQVVHPDMKFDFQDNVNYIDLDLTVMVRKIW